MKSQKKKYLLKGANYLGIQTGRIAEAPFSLLGKKLNSPFLKDVGGGLNDTTTFVSQRVGEFSQGVWDIVDGAVSQEKRLVDEGLSEVVTSTYKMTEGIGKSIGHTLKNSSDVIVGIASKDYKRASSAAKKVGKTIVIGGMGFLIVDVLTDGSDVSANASEIVRIDTINSDLAGSTHPVSGVEYQLQTVDLPDGMVIEGTFPVFEEVYGAEIPESMYLSSDYLHFKEANAQLGEAIISNPQLAEQFDNVQLEQIMNGETPDGYTWHHHEQPGVIQLIDTESHDLSGHTGGRVLWGGGNDYR
ncbi:MAG: HNH endonuclease [Bacillaceae bacterium]|nr:HNH endonuclease [Bacillaceae bacterium]